MKAAHHPHFASPVTLLQSWAAEGRALHEAVFLGYTVDLPFLERVAIPVARGLGARTAVIGDAAQGLYDAVDVRLAGRSYLHGFASCRGAFHPKVVLLTGESGCHLAVGSGNPTLSGWGANDELWTVVKTEDGASHAMLADLADWLEELPHTVDMAPWSAEHLQYISQLLTEQHIKAPAGTESGPRLLHNLRRSLLEQLPTGPVDELHAYAPFVDPSGKALSAIVERLAPRRTVLGIQPRWTSYDAATIRRALDGTLTDVRLLPETRMLHGKLIEWRTGDQWHALTGSPNLTRAALGTSTRNGGNCELAVLASDTALLLPEEGQVAPLATLAGSTVRHSASRSRPALVLLGAKTNSEGMHISLAGTWPTPVLISVSPDGSPGSWTPLGSIPAGSREHSFPLLQDRGTAVRATCAGSDGRTLESPVVFAYSPIHCARRDGTDSGPRLSHTYTVQTLFTDESAARRFEADLLRLRELIPRSAHTGPGTSGAEHNAAGTVTTAVHNGDQWDSYVQECRRMMGDAMTALALRTTQFALPQAPSSQWIVSPVNADAVTELDEADSTDEEEEAEEPGAMGRPGVPVVPPDLRAPYRMWARRWVRAIAPVPDNASPRDRSSPRNRSTPPSRSPFPLPVRLTVASLLVQLLAAGVWEEHDQSWRDTLSELLRSLHPEAGTPNERLDPHEAQQRRDAVVAVLMALLSQDATLTGGGELDVRAARAWRDSSELIARADPAEAADLLFPPQQPHARTAAWSEVERLVALAREDDPSAAAVEELRQAGWEVEWEDGLWTIHGSFANPIPVVARAATRLGRHRPRGVLVRARGRTRWAFAAWAAPYLVLYNSAAHVWRTYRVQPPATPESRFNSGDLSSVAGLIGTSPLRAGAPETLQKILTDLDVAYSAMSRRLFPAMPCQQGGDRDQSQVTRSRGM
ncbi:hypothetical protein [Streptomyces sp. NPDC053542]|uniref:hypothetical protein n=1 Tax=Streptomyces sp. NPDC053542 TaxID=3365710 RepID=UPI0037D4B263